jgi:hypothetical protein
MVCRSEMLRRRTWNRILLQSEFLLLFPITTQKTKRCNELHGVTQRAVIAHSVQRLGYGLDDQGSRVRFSAGAGNFFFLPTTASRTALGPSRPPIQWETGPLSLGVKRPGREADHSPPSSAEVKNARSYSPTTSILYHGVVLS